MKLLLNIFRSSLYLKSLLLCLLFPGILSSYAFSQNISSQISGIVLDNNQQPLAGVAIRLSGNTDKDYITDTSGAFNFKELKPGAYTLAFEASGFKAGLQKVILPGNANHLKIALQENATQLGEVEVTAQKQQPVSTLAHSELNENELKKDKGKSLGQLLEQIPGVSAVQSGPTLSKPAIHGLSGNRVLLMNNGVRQEGQQWGDDHAPELDPNNAGSITVVKGAASVRYGSDALGGVVLMDPPPLPQEKSIRGSIGILGTSNGRKGSVDGDIEGAFGKKPQGLLSWRLQGTLKQAGNFRTPHYFLDNTGTKEGSYTAQLGYQWKKLNLSADYSSYNSKIGIFSGSEVGNAAELATAYQQRNHPTTADSFTYKIAGGYQQINHDILKLGADYTFANNGKLSLTYAWQKDLRQEYSSDPHYGADSTLLTIPDDWFHLITNTVDLVYTEPYREGFSGSFGLSGHTNINQYLGLEARPLIPNYQDLGAGMFAIERYSREKWLVEGGLRYDYLQRKVDAPELTTTDKSQGEYAFHNVTGTLGATYHFNNHFLANVNFGMGWRPPGAEEMFIYGVHSSAAQFAMGDSLLQIEQSYNTSLSLNYHTDKLKVAVAFYNNEINNFIYLNPIGIRQIDGNAYHAFQYVQDNVQLLGADISAQWELLPALAFSTKTSLLRATNKTRDGGLINMPPAKFQNGLTFHLDEFGKLKQPYFSLENVSVLKQNYIVADQRELLPPPPPGYSIWNINMGCKFPIGKNNLDINFAVDNLTNKVYSDYLNQFRYFAYDLGINFALRASFSF